MRDDTSEAEFKPIPQQYTKVHSKPSREVSPDDLIGNFDERAATQSKWVSLNFPQFLTLFD